MKNPETYQFEELKKQTVIVFKEKHFAPDSFKDWKGNDIVLFQEDLSSKLNTKVSEKWFYTYFKNESNKLPRIDMLNILSNYVGFQNWNHFKQSHPFEDKKEKGKTIKFVGFAILFVLIISSIIFLDTKHTFNFCFIDQIRNEPIRKTSLKIEILHDDQSSTYKETDSAGCFNWTTKKSTISFVVSSPFHKTDTITRNTEMLDNSVVKLVSDEYALMLYYFSNNQVDNWQNHKKDLEKLILDDAKIYRLYDDTIGFEIYSKDAFIRTLLIPTETLKKVEILDRSYKNGQIESLKFIIR